MNNRMYLNGKPVTLWQKIIGSILGVAIFVFMVTAGFVFFVIATVIALICGIYIMWKTRKLRAEINRRMSQSQAEVSKFQQSDKSKGDKSKGEIYEGDYKEL